MIFLHGEGHQGPLIGLQILCVNSTKFMTDFVVFYNKSLSKNCLSHFSHNLLSANPTKWLNTLKQFVGCCRRIV